MTQPALIQSRLQAGTWHATLTNAGTTQPDLRASHEGRDLAQPEVRGGDLAGVWHVALPVPAEILNEGLQTIVLRLADGTTLGSLAILSGEALAEDLRAEIGLLRAELDILKTAFRRSQRQG